MSKKLARQGRKAQQRPDTTCHHQNDLHLCDYCGDDITREEIDSAADRDIHKACVSHNKRTEEAVGLLKKYYAKSPNVIPIAIHVNYLYGFKDKPDSNKKLKRSLKLVQLTKIVSALRNSGSGYVLIHLVGLAPGDRYTGYFDEFADPKLRDLLVDGSQFDDVYKKELLCDIEDIWELEENREKNSQYGDFLVLYVDGSDYLVTSDFKTKTALDDCIVDPPDLSVFRFLSNRKEFQEVIPQPNPNLNTLRESRSIQLKSYFPQSDSNGIPVSYIFEHKLVEYISGFTKNSAGGSYYLGVAEEETSFPGANYKSKIVSFTPVSVTNQEELKEFVKQQVRDTVLVCDYDGHVSDDADIVKVEVLPIPARAKIKKTIDTKDNCLICVLARSVQGIVFYDKEGPLAYKVGSDCKTVSKLDLKEWFSVFLTRPDTVGI